MPSPSGQAKWICWALICMYYADASQPMEPGLDQGGCLNAAGCSLAFGPATGNLSG